MRVVLRVTAALLALGLMAPSLADEEGALTDVVKSARRKAIRELESLAKWAAKKKAAGFRHTVYEKILILKPDHSRGRKVLGYRRDGKQGPWVRRGEYKRPVDWDKGAARTGEAQLVTRLTTYKKKVLEALDARPNAPSAQVDALFDELLALLPDDKALRSQTGDIQFEGRWVHPDTQAGTERRRRLTLDAEKRRARAEREVESVDAETKGSWSAGWTGGDYTVLGTVSDRIVKSACVLMVVADTVCDDLLGKAKKIRGPRVTYIMRNRKQARAIVARTKSWRTSLKTLDEVSGLWPSNHEKLVYWTNQDLSRLSCPRGVIDQGLMRRFGKHGRGWIRAGLGQRMCWYACAEHGPNFVNLTQTSRERATVKVPDDPDQWPAAAARVLEKVGPAALTGVLTRSLNAMGGEDVLVAYGLAAFLIETRPDEFLPFVEATVKRHDVEVYVQETLGAPSVADLADHLARWLREYRVP